MFNMHFVIVRGIPVISVRYESLDYWSENKRKKRMYSERNIVKKVKRQPTLNPSNAPLN